MLVIRFLRVGKKNQPSFQVVVAEKEKAPRSGRFIEKVGFYSPLTKKKELNAERIQYWLSVGAKPSDTVWNMLVSAGIVTAKKKPVHKKSKAPQDKNTEESASAASDVVPPAATTEPEVKPKEAEKEPPKEAQEEPAPAVSDAVAAASEAEKSAT